jgi:SAM-dependent methyltransferase
MDKNFEKQYHDVETSHWWFKARRKYLLRLLKNAPKNSKILDIGCSSGIFLKDLEAQGFNMQNLYGIDISGNAVKNCHKNGIQNAFVMDAQHITLEQKFDIIVASDCLEHLEDEKKALENWKNLLAPGGKMYVFVPAFQSLWSHHDVVNMHYRRYTRKELTTRMAGLGLNITASGYWNMFLFLPAYIVRRIAPKLGKKQSPHGDIATNNGLVNTLLLQLLSIENRLPGFMRFPFGVSTFCIAAKKP